MSFDLGPIKQPMIQGSQNLQNNGGGGNLGYMQRGRKKKNEDETDENILLGKDEPDMLQLNIESDENETSENFSTKEWLGNIVNKIVPKINKKPENPFENS